MTGRGWSVHRRGYDLIKWSGAECAECALPVEIVLLDADPVLDNGSRVAIERKIRGYGGGREGMIAAQVIAGRMHGYRVTKTRPGAKGYALFTPHRDVCPDAPPPEFEQHSLFDTTTEGDT